ncbi:MAG: hypothetical protein IJX64_01375, partial [Clostridia bacterium]|nr:hypothetical protein [Clostridia bacterium]
KFENLRIITMDKNLVFLCNGYYTCFGEGLEVSALSSSATLPSIVGGTVGTLYQGTGTVQGKTTVYRAEDAKMTVLALPTENMDAAAVQAAKAANEAAMQAAFAEEFVIRSTIPFAERNVTASGEASKQTASVSACGDLNGDGRVTVTDVKALLGAALRASVTNIFARDPSFRCACIRHCLIQ